MGYMEYMDLSILACLHSMYMLFFRIWHWLMYECEIKDARKYWATFTFLHFFNLLEMVQSLHNCTWLELTLYSWYPAMIRLFVGHKKELGWQVILLCSTFFALGSFSAPIFHLHCYELRWNLNFPPWTSKKTEDFSFL